ncbi:hypothetical protein [Cognatilysobacter bugurensis]|uniref:Transmembrane protein n=1 Tax=Cognatilysobacter bugurensis TaxID=543356 RepID=A0A918T2V0_9GAMM|nr:hypothetical protein [Lysobacter bugurensis]GHA86093.1 hypothetical protein GCM10007067_25180 [Lysobacter bugurensis]
MSPLVELNLTLILFLPWFLILTALYWWVPRQPRPRARIVFDLLAIAVAAVAFIASVHWANAEADPTYGRMWRQVLATAVGYGVFLGTLVAAFFIRRRWLLRSGPGR